MKLQNGFNLEGNISTSMIKLNDTSTQVLIVESALEVEQLRELFKNNNIITEINGDTETTYNTSGLIDVKSQDSKNYVWLYFNYSNVNSTNQELKNKLADVLKTDLNFETINFLYSMNQIAKDDVFAYVKSGNITQSDYKTITGEDCPELPLDTIKLFKIKEMSKICENKIINEFYSSCLGEKKRFDCTRDDQTYIMGLASKAQLILSGAATDKTLDWKASGEPVCYPWQPQQALILGQDLFNHLTEKKKRYEQIRDYIQTKLTTEEAVNSITWESDVNATQATT